MRTEYHPKLNILVREDGCIFLPQSGNNHAHWTYGSKNGRGYRHVQLAGKLYSVHRLVAEAFFGEIPEGYEVDHINRDRSNNAVDNLRIVTSHENHCNTSSHDRVEEQGRTHKYQDKKQYKREWNSRNREKRREWAARYRAEHPEKVCEQHARYSKEKRNTHRRVYFSDGSRHYIPLNEAILLLAIPLKERHYGK